MTSDRPTGQVLSDELFEEHLLGFRPVPPRRLAIPSRRTLRATAAVAAGIVLVAGISFVSHQGQPATLQHRLAQSVTIGKLNAALRENDETLNQLLDDASPNILRHSQHGTVLYELGKE